MKHLLTIVALAGVLSPGLDAQALLVRGRIESSGQNRFHLAATKIPVTSQIVALRPWVGADVVIQVVDTGVAGAPLLRVERIAAVQRDLDMTPLSLSAPAKLVVQAPAGAVAFVFVDLAANCGFTPLDPFGAWLLGPTPQLAAVGRTDGNGQFAATWAVPGDRQLLGVHLTSQVLIGQGGGWYLGNADRQPIVP
jgi:hypothetical protein